LEDNDVGFKIAPLALVLCGVFHGCGGEVVTSPTSAQVNLNPNAPRSISFSGYTWDVRKSLTARIGAGPNFFSDSPDSVFVDSSGLHMKITKMLSGGVTTWYSSEVVLRQPLGYGQYVFELEGGFENIDINAVLGLFTYESDGPPPNYREIDIEFTRLGIAGTPNSQFVVQPFTVPANIFRFEFGAYPISSHAFKWTPNRVDFESQGGAQNVRWTYTGPNVPEPGNEKARIELWMNRDRAPASGQEIEVVIRSFRFVR
jgi:hypothetical protein